MSPSTAGAVASARRRAVAAVPGNLITNGDFSGGDAGWSGFYYSGKSPSGGKAVFTNSPTFDGIFQSVTLVVGKYYQVTYTVSSRTSGAALARLLGGTNRSGTARSANGTFVERLLANTGNNTFEICLETTGTLSIDDVSVVGPYDTATVGGT